ncbi:MAG: TRAP transporter substrate-binding protein DctP, partial [Succinivibrio sp.]
MKFKKVLLAAAVCASAAFCNGAFAADVLNFKLGFVDPANSSYAQGGQKFADELAKLTDGKIKVQVVAGGTLGGEREMYEGAQMGTMDMITVVNTVLSQFIPELVLLDQPFLFDTDEQAHAAVDGKLGQLIAKKAEAQGVHI